MGTAGAVILVVDHEFGNVSTDLKLSLVEGYLGAFTKALRGKFKHLWYIDAFAGTGYRTVRHAARSGDLVDAPVAERVEQRRGSARIAIDVNPHFDRLIFMDKNKRHCAALRTVAEGHPDREIEIVNGDANSAIDVLLKRADWTSTRAVMFLDPFGMNVDWSTLQAIRRTEAIDVWYLVSLAGLFRQAARSAAAVDKIKRAALTRMLGSDEWEAAWYEQSPAKDLLGAVDQIAARTANVEAIERHVGERLRTLFPKVLLPRRLRNARGVPMSSLFFLISNPEPKAMVVATRIANHMLKAGMSSQVRPR